MFSLTRLGYMVVPTLMPMQKEILYGTWTETDFEST